MADVLFIRGADTLAICFFRSSRGQTDEINQMMARVAIFAPVNQRTNRPNILGSRFCTPLTRENRRKYIPCTQLSGSETADDLPSRREEERWQREEARWKKRKGSWLSTKALLQTEVEALRSQLDELVTWKKGIDAKQTVDSGSIEHFLLARIDPLVAQSHSQTNDLGIQVESSNEPYTNESSTGEPHVGEQYTYKSELQAPNLQCDLNSHSMTQEPGSWASGVAILPDSIVLEDEISIYNARGAELLEGDAVETEEDLGTEPHSSATVWECAVEAPSAEGLSMDLSLESVTVVRGEHEGREHDGGSLQVAGQEEYPLNSDTSSLSTMRRLKHLDVHAYVHNALRTQHMRAWLRNQEIAD